MKDLNNYIVERGAAPGLGDRKPLHKNPAVNMIQSIFDELSKHNDCKYNKEKDAWVGKDADLWKGAGQFLFDYTQELNQKDFEEIVDHFGWKQFIPDINDIHPAEISMCVALMLNSNKQKEN